MGDKVLVVDDEQEIRDLLNTFLTQQGYDVFLASNGTAAIQLANQEDPGVILLDVKMPEIDGIEVCKRLKAEEKTKSIPIIILTGLGDRELEAYLEGADDFVRKPFLIEELSIRVKSALHIRNLTNELDRALAYIKELEKNLAGM